MAEYKASKAQQKALVGLGIKFDQYITYSAAGDALEAAGWSRDGRTQEIHDENYAGNYYRDHELG